MSSSIRTNICVAAAAVFLTLAAAAPVAAETEEGVFFRGFVQGLENDTLQGNPPDRILVDGSLPGLASNLGRCTLKYKLTVSLPAGSSTGTGQLVASNGDTIYTTVVGQGVAIPGVPGLNRIVEHNTITGGTGRFSGVEGSFIVERLIELDGPTGFTSGSFRGAITSKGQTD
jgi:hypothetical protein